MHAREPKFVGAPVRWTFDCHGGDHVAHGDVLENGGTGVGSHDDRPVFSPISSETSTTNVPTGEEPVTKSAVTVDVGIGSPTTLYWMVRALAIGIAGTGPGASQVMRTLHRAKGPRVATVAPLSGVPLAEWTARGGQS